MEGTGRKMKAAYALALTVPVEDIEEWLEEDYFDTADSRVDSLFYRVLYERYLDADPEAFPNRSLHKNYTTTHTARYMKEWTRRDPAAAREFLERQGNWKKYRTVAEAVIQQLAVTDKAAALELIEASDDRMGPNSLNIGNGLKEIALGDPDGLMLSAQRWSEPLRKRALDASAEAVLGRDFLEGVAWIQEQGGPQAVTVMRDAMGQQKKFGAQLLKHAAQLPDGWMTKILQYESWSLARNDPENQEDDEEHGRDDGKNDGDVHHRPGKAPETEDGRNGGDDEAEDREFYHGRGMGGTAAGSLAREVSPDRPPQVHLRLAPLHEWPLPAALRYCALLRLPPLP